jgi:glycerol uptake facilitator-like aquaporin
MQKSNKKKEQTSGGLFVYLLAGVGRALAQLWLFWVAPIAGAVAAGVTHRTLIERDYRYSRDLP